MAKTNGRILLLSLVVLAFFSEAAMASGIWRSGFDEYGYNERLAVFKGCWTNYLKWKTGAPAVECPENDLQILAKWKFDRNGSLVWLVNIFNSPTGQLVLKTYVTISQEQCAARGGRWMGFQKVTQTNEIVPVCEILEAAEGEGILLIATPPGFKEWLSEHTCNE
jgi:hypothetical protein